MLLLFKTKLAFEAFQHTASYDSAISNWIGEKKDFTSSNFIASYPLIFISVRNWFVKQLERREFIPKPLKGTTQVAAVILFFLGSGPIRGFSITLGLGVVSTILCTMIISRLLINYFYILNSNRKIEI